jgi:hypothetical protein
MKTGGERAMPITFVLVLFTFLGVLLLVPALLAFAILLATGRNHAALVVISLPLDMIGLSLVLIAGIFIMAGLNSRVMSARPTYLFETTFGFKPLAQTCVLEAYHETIMDYGTTVMKFNTTRDIINKIVTHNFVSSDRETFLSAYNHNRDNLPDHVRSWFSLPDTQTEQFYVAEAFDKSFGSSEAILCHDEETQTAYFHWIGVD